MKKLFLLTISTLVLSGQLCAVKDSKVQKTTHNTKLTCISDPDTVFPGDERKGSLLKRRVGNINLTIGVPKETIQARRAVVAKKIAEARKK